MCINITLYTLCILYNITENIYYTTKSCKEIDYLSKQFNSLELQKAIDAMKNYKAAGLDDICTEQLRHLGPGAKNG